MKLPVEKSKGPWEKGKKNNSRKNIWDTMDELEGKKDSSYEHLVKEKKRQQVQ
jgi:hypothetical protein